MEVMIDGIVYSVKDETKKLAINWRPPVYIGQVIFTEIFDVTQSPAKFLEVKQTKATQEDVDDFKRVIEADGAVSYDSIVQSVKNEEKNGVKYLRFSKPVMELTQESSLDETQAHS